MTPKHPGWRLVSEYGIVRYRCGLVSGDKVRVIDKIVIKTNGKPTGKVHEVGEIWTVLGGVEDEPEVIWLRDADGKRGTWDSASFFTYFKKHSPENA
jgi:hypothetical protein